MKIAFLRHGPTEWNAQGRIQGHTDIPLSEAGLTRMQGLRLPSSFAGAHAYVSPLLRARQTAQALGLAKAVFDSRLMEQNWGRWEGLSRAEIMAREGADVFVRHGLGRAFHPPGGESTAALHARVAQFLSDIAAGGGDAVAVAHLGVLRAAYTLATGWDMATPMPEDLDVSRILVLETTQSGAPILSAKNVDFIANMV